MWWAVPPVALLYSPIVATNAASWALVAVYLRWWTFLAAACYFSAGLLAARPYFGAFSSFLHKPLKKFLTPFYLCPPPPPRRRKQRDINLEACDDHHRLVVVRPTMYLVAR